MTELLGRHGDLGIRLARPSDDPGLRALLAEVPTPGRPSITQEREPGFFELLRLHGGAAETYVAEAPDGTLVACGSLVVRRGTVGQAVHPIGHVGDLRIRPAYRGGGLLAAMGGLAFLRARDQHDVRLGCSVALASNRRLRGAVIARGAGREAQPPGKRVAAYDMVSVVVPPNPRASELDLTTANSTDIEALGAFLGKASRGRLFGYDMSPQMLRRRLNEWPGLKISDFLVVRRAGRLVGCAAPWDPSPVRQTRIQAWGVLAPVVRLLDARRNKAGLSPLPKRGEHLRMGYLTHSHVEENDPGVFAALVAGAWAWSTQRGLHGVAAMVPEGSAIRAGLPRAVTRTRVHVHAIALRDTEAPVTDLAGNPGLEMAIA
jgi:hypothetical protein